MTWVTSTPQILLRWPMLDFCKTILVYLGTYCSPFLSALWQPMTKLQLSWFWSQHPPTQRNLRGGRWSRLEQSNKKTHEIPRILSKHYVNNRLRFDSAFVGIVSFRLALAVWFGLYGTVNYLVCGQKQHEWGIRGSRFWYTPGRCDRCSMVKQCKTGLKNCFHASGVVLVHLALETQTRHEILKKITATQPSWNGKALANAQKAMLGLTGRWPFPATCWTNWDWGSREQPKIACADVQTMEESWSSRQYSLW